MAVPRGLLELDSVAFAAWFAIARRSRPNPDSDNAWSATVWPRQEWIAEGMGGASERTVRNALSAIPPEYLRVERVGKRQGNRYSVPNHGGTDWIRVPVAGHDALVAGKINRAEFLAYARWLSACGRRGETRESLAAYAARWDESVRQARRHRTALVAAELLEVEETPGEETLVRRPGGGGEDPGHKLPVTPDTDCTTPIPHPLPAPLPSPRSGQEVTPARATPPAAARDPIQREALQLLCRIDALNATRRGIRGAILALLTKALAEGYGMDAIGEAIVRELPVYALEAHVDDVRRALRGLTADVLAGACRTCGQYPDEFIRFACAVCAYRPPPAPSVTVSAGPSRPLTRR